MKIVLASGNRGKIREIRELFGDDEVLPYTDLIPKIEVEENGNSFKENAILKAEAVYRALQEQVEGRGYVVLADDSGITVPALGNVPGIYSARFAKEGASDRENLQKLIDMLKERGLSSAPAYYTAAIAIVSPEGTFTVHGWMYGRVIDEARGEKGFGYDPIFIPEGYERTLGELDGEVKRALSHRSRALARVRRILRGLNA